MEDTAAKKDLPALKKLATNSSDMFPEETLVGRLQAGQLDAGFYYASEAAVAKIPTVQVTGEDLGATYTLTVLNHDPHRAAAVKFVSFLLGPAGQRILTQDGFRLVTPPKVTGTGVPAGLKGLLAK
jgi:molybdate/tungstate transport system substrate-binding protein